MADDILGSLVLNEEHYQLGHLQMIK